MKIAGFPIVGAVLTSFRGLYLIAALVLILSWTYLFGHPIVEGHLVGSDTGYHLALVSWIDRWFPELPQWYPLQGTGSSSIIQYPYGAHYAVVLLSRLTGFGVVDVFRMFQITSVAATAIGIYCIAWRKLRSMSAALIAGLIYPISSAAWHWLAGIGFFSFSVSLALFAPAFLLFDFVLSSYEASRKGLNRKKFALALLSASALFAAMVVTHVVTAYIFAATFLCYSFFIRAIQPKSSRIKGALLQVPKALMPILAGLALAGFWIVPFLYTSSLANREGGIFDFSQTPKLNLLSVIGLNGPPAGSIYGPTVIAMPALILAFIGFAISLRRNKFVTVLGLVSIFFALLAMSPEILLIPILQRASAFMNVRGIIPALIFIPVIAGYGVAEVSTTAVNLTRSLILRLIKTQNGEVPVRQSLSAFASGIAAVLALFIAVASFLYLRYAPPGYGEYQGYGFPRDEAWWPFEFDGESVEINSWPTFQISSDEWPNYGKMASGLSDSLGLDSDTRLDISPNLGGLLEVLPIYADSSTAGIYYFAGSLIRPMRGYQAGAYFSEDKGTPHEVVEFAKWLGIEYVVLDNDLDAVDKFDEIAWHPVKLPEQGHLSKLKVMRFNTPTGLASTLNKPEILVIGGYKSGKYESIFRLFNSGIVEYEEATIVEGTSRIDDYSLEQLEEFEVVFLRGYDHKNRDLAWSLLSDYVRNGGSLYVDTGWQYWIPEWEMKEAPEVLPVRDLVWMSAGSDDQLVLLDAIELQDVDVGQFAPMRWNDQPWGISSPSSGLRDWALPVLESQGKPLIAMGEFGKGKVIWSGMNLVGHIRTYENTQEKGLLRDIMRWLMPQSGAEPADGLEIYRDDPDHIRLAIEGPISEGTNLIWREAFAPGWAASVELGGSTQDLPIYRAGPGMMLVHLPATEGDRINLTLEYSIAPVRGLGISITVLSGVVLVGIVIAPAVIPRRHRVATTRADLERARNRRGSSDGYMIHDTQGRDSQRQTSSLNTTPQPLEEIDNLPFLSEQPVHSSSSTMKTTEKLPRDNAG